MMLAVVTTPHAAMAKKHHSKKHHAPHHHSRAVVDRTAAYADIVINADTGQILHDTDSDELRHPASLTKMMTLYLTFQALQSGKLHLNEYLPVSANAAEQSPSKLGLRPGQRIRAEDAILGLVTESANDAAVVLGEWLGGSEEDFGAMMTKQAHALGMSNSQFKNPSGLPDPDQVTTARDMATLGLALMHHFPQYYPYFSTDHFVYMGINHHNHNHLMERYDGMDGIKTGYIRASGFNLVASAKHGSTRLIGVVFGGHSAFSRDNRMAELLDEAFAGGGKIAAPKTTTPAAQGDADDSDERPAPAAKAKAAPTPAAEPHVMKSPAPSAPAAMQQAIVQSGPSAAQIIQGSGKTRWGIQIGAYSDADIGRQALADITRSVPDLLRNSDAQIQTVTSAGTTVYRARLMDLDQKSAQKACGYLVAHGRGCQIITP